MIDDSMERCRVDSIYATDISLETYLDKYAAYFYEWRDGDVIQKSIITVRHNDVSFYVRILIDCYLELRPIGRTIAAPFVMQLGGIPSCREPDLQVILNTNPGKLTETAMLGAADICIEIVSEGSQETDYVTKFVEYQQAGVREYWLIDPLTEQPRFFRLNADGRYEPQSPDADGYYETPLLPGLKLHVPTLWSDPLPNTLAVVQAVQTMLGSG